MPTRADGKPFQYHPKKCEGCGEEYTPTTGRQRFCKPACQTTRWCPRCEEEKPSAEFYQRDGRAGGYCKPCHGEVCAATALAAKKRDPEAFAARRREYVRRYCERNPEKVAAYLRSYKRFRKYGVSDQRYEEMLAIQDGRCALCRGDCPRGQLSVDHDHATGAVRKLLCRKCNLAVGHVERIGLSSLIEYLA